MKKLLSLDDIQLELETQEITPSRAADLSILVSAKYGRAADMYIKANAEYAHVFNKSRADHKSDTACERAIDTSEIGLTKHHWKYQLKKCEQMQTALKNLVYVKTAEARNQV
jgi:hypothetical protein